MKRSLFAGLLLAVACLMAGMPSADADPRFGPGDIRGPYGFAFDGFIELPPALGGRTPVAAVGRFVGDGQGQLTEGTRTLVVGGVAVSQTFTCDYSVNEDGNGHADCIVTTPPSTQHRESFDVVAFNKGDEASFTAVPPATTLPPPAAGPPSTIRGLAKRQR